MKVSAVPVTLQTNRNQRCFISYVKEIVYNILQLLTYLQICLFPHHYLKLQWLIRSARRSYVIVIFLPTVAYTVGLDNYMALSSQSFHRQMVANSHLSDPGLDV